jgi:murein L,D-transpeptidase YcbB/YkuD
MLCFTIAAIAFAGFSMSALAQVTATQIKLTENQIERFIAAQDAMLAVVEKIGAASSDHANTEYDAALDAITKKYGFKDLAEFDAVATNISMVMAGIDPETKVFTDPQMAMKKEINDVRSDKSIPSSEKRNLLEQLNAALEAAEPIRFPTNIALVRKHYDKLDVTTIGISDGNSRPSSGAVRTISEAK